MSRTRIGRIAAIALAGLTSAAAFAQTTPTPAGSAAPAQPPIAPAGVGQPGGGQPGQAQMQVTASGWVTLCRGPSRKGPLDCTIEQSLALARGGQMALVVSLRFPPQAQQPTMTLQLPQGLFLPGGAKIRIDAGTQVTMPIRTCEAQGCFAVAPLAPELLTGLRAGKRLEVTVQNMAQENLVFGMALEGFSIAYEKAQ